MSDKDLAVKQNTPLATNTMFESEKDSGFEDMGMQDFVMPMLKLFQKLSPELDSTKDEYIEGAKVGQFMDSATKEIFDTLDVIPCLFQPAEVEWKPDRGGFVAQHEIGYGATVGATKDPKTGKGITKDKNELVLTYYYFCLRFSKIGELIPIVLAFTGTQIKHAKQWNSQMEGIRFQGKNGPYRPPTYSHIYTVSAGDDENKKGAWKTYQIKINRPIGEKETEMFLKAKDMRTSFQQTSKNLKPVQEVASEAAQDPSKEAKM